MIAVPKDQPNEPSLEYETTETVAREVPTDVEGVVPEKIFMADQAAPVTATQDGGKAWDVSQQANVTGEDVPVFDSEQHVQPSIEGKALEQGQSKKGI